MKSAYDVLNVVSCDSLQQTIDQLKHERDSLQALVVTPRETKAQIHVDNTFGIVGLIVVCIIVVTFIKAL